MWEHESATDHEQRVVPDGCLELLWMGEHGLVIAGADTGPRTARLAADVRLSGIRLRASAAGAVFGLPASELRDRQVDAALVWRETGARVTDELANGSPARRLRLLAETVGRRRAEPDLLVHEAARLLAIRDARVTGVAGRLGVGERTLRRRMLASVGYGPKMLARVARLRRLVALNDESLAARAYAAGYASQAHMNEDVLRLTGATPAAFLKDAALTAA